MKKYTQQDSPQKANKFCVAGEPQDPHKKYTCWALNDEAQSEDVVQWYGRWSYRSLTLRTAAGTNLQSEPQRKKDKNRVCNDHNDDDEAFSVVQFDVLVKLANELQ